MIIGIVGYKGSGKTAVAQRLVDHHGFMRLSMAQQLKNMLRTLGLNEDQIQGALKEVPCDLLGGKTPRWAMQSLGTEWGRRMIVDDIWVRAWKHACPFDQDVVCDDVRFPNEAEALTKMGAKLLRVVRPGHDPEYRQHFWQFWLPKAHESEAHVPRLPVQHALINDRTLLDLESNVDLVIRRWR